MRTHFLTAKALDAFLIVIGGRILPSVIEINSLALYRTDLYAYSAFSAELFIYLRSSFKGVELGKKLALNILPEIEGTAFGVEHDSSTSALINYIKKIRK